MKKGLNNLHSSFNKITLGILCLCLILVFLSNFQLSLKKIFDPDEFNQLHTAYLLKIGRLPYRDFLIGIPPSFAAFLLPLFFLFKGTAVLIQARVLMFLFNLAIAFLLYKIFSLFSKKETALLALLFTFTSPFWLAKGFEIRVDLAIIFLFLTALWMILKSINNLPRVPTQRRDLRGQQLTIIPPSLLLGLALTVQQRAIFPVFAVSLIFFIKILIEPAFGNKSISWKQRLNFFFLFAFGLILPFILLLICLNFAGILPQALKSFFIYSQKAFSNSYPNDAPRLYLGFVKDFSYSNFYAWIYYFHLPWLRLTQVVFILAAINFFLKVFVPIIKSKERKKLEISPPARLPDGQAGGWELEIIVVALFLSLYLFRLKLLQYWLSLMPFVAFLAAELITKTTGKISPFIKNILLISLAGIITLTNFQVTKRILAKNTNEQPLSAIEFILQHTQKNDPVYDGMGMAVFRPDCLYASMTIAWEIPKEVSTPLAEALEKSNCRAIIKGPYNRFVGWPESDQKYLEENFLPTAHPDVFMRK